MPEHDFRNQSFAQTLGREGVVYFQCTCMDCDRGRELSLGFR